MPSSATFNHDASMFSLVCRPLSVTEDENSLTRLALALTTPSATALTSVTTDTAARSGIYNPWMPLRF